MKKIFYTLTLILFLSSCLRAGGFSNIEVMPANASLTDSVKVCYKYTAVSWPVTIHTHQLIISDSNTYVTVCFGMGQRDLISVFYDTVNIGVYPIAGNYQVTLYINLTSLDDTLCANSIWYDSAQAFFTVTKPTGILDNKTNHAFSFFPNPTNDKLNCSVTNAALNSTIQISTIEGKTVLTGIPVTQSNFEIDVSTLPAGIYFLQLSDEKQRVVRKFVKQ